MSQPRYKVVVLPGATYVLPDGGEGEAPRIDIYMLVGRDAFERYYSGSPLAEGSVRLEAKFYDMSTGRWIPYELRLVKVGSVPLGEDNKQGQQG